MRVFGCRETSEICSMDIGYGTAFVSSAESTFKGANVILRNLDNHRNNLAFIVTMVMFE